MVQNGILQVDPQRIDIASKETIETVAETNPEAVKINLEGDNPQLLQEFTLYYARSPLSTDQDIIENFKFNLGSDQACHCHLIKLACNLFQNQV